MQRLVGENAAALVDGTLVNRGNARVTKVLVRSVDIPAEEQRKAKV